MKKIYLLALILAFWSQGIAQSYIEIGSGTVSTSYPIYSVWNYGWYSMIYPQTAIGASKTISKIAFQCINGPKTCANQKIYMANNPASVFGAATYDNPTSLGYTLVYDGAVNFNGWTEILLSTPFAYNGTDNLVIQWENRSGSSSYANFNSTTSTINNNKGAGSDSGFPLGAGYLNPYPSSLPNVRLYYPTTAPATPANPVPASPSFKTDLNTSLQFNLGTNTLNYDLYFGTDSLQVADLNASLKIVDNAAGATPGAYSYNFPSILTPSTKYFWRVVAKSGASATNSPLWKFITQNVIQNFPYTQGFEGNDVFFPGWYGYYTDWTYPTTGAGQIWGLSGNVNAHSGLAALNASPPSGTTLVESSIKTPRFFLPANQRIGFWWRNGNYIRTEGADSTFFEITTNGGQNWTTINTLSPASAQSAYGFVTQDLSAYAGNNVYLRWRYKKSATAAVPVFIDDILIEAIPAGAVAGFDVSSLTFIPIFRNAHTSLPLIISNTGTTDLAVSGITVAAPFSCDYTGIIPAGTSQTISIMINGTTTGTFNQMLTVNHNGTGASEIQVSGTVLDNVASFYQTFESVTPGNLPSNWGKLRSTDPYQSLNDVQVKNSSFDAYSVPNVVRMYNNTDTISPLIMLTEGVTNFNLNTLTFYASKTYGNFQEVNLLIGLMDDPNNGASFEIIQTIVLTDNMTQYSVTFSSSNTKPYIAFRHGNLKQIQSIWIDDVKWEGVINNPPAAAALVFPSNGLQNNELNLTMSWTPTTGDPTGYKLYFGTNNPPTNIVNATDLGNVLTFSATGLVYATTYFWKIVPYNAYGDAPNCPVWSFSTMDNPTLTVPWSEGFENLTPGAGFNYPLGWSIINNNDQWMGWDVIANSALNTGNAHTGEKAIHTAFTYLNPLDDWLVSPPIQLYANQTQSVSFWLKSPVYISGTDTSFEKFELLWGNGNTASALTNSIYRNEHLRMPEYQRISATISVPSDGLYYLGFHTYSDPLQWLVMVDDISMSINTGTSEIKKQADFIIYPNPANTNARIMNTDLIKKNAGFLVNIYSITGKLLHSQQNNLVIPVSDLIPGIYIVELKTGEKAYYSRFAKN